MDRNKALIIGCGYRGMKLAARLQAKGYDIFGMTRSEEKAQKLASLNIKPVMGDVRDMDAVGTAAAGMNLIYHMLGAMQGEEETLRDIHIEGTLNVISAIEPEHARCYIYESSTAVYGQQAGEWIEEGAPTLPTSRTGKLRVAAESIVRDSIFELELPAVIVRTGAIYRPESMVNDKIKKNNYVIQTYPRKVMNHIYIDDYLELLSLVPEKAKPGGVYNLVDNEPHPALDYFNAIAELMGVQPPPVDFTMPRDEEGCVKLMRESNKKVSNKKVKEHFGYTFRFPTYREGLRDCAEKNWMENHKP